MYLLPCRYVTKKDIDRNAVYVSRSYFAEDKSRNSFCCGGFSWIDGPPDLTQPLEVIKGYSASAVLSAYFGLGFWGFLRLSDLAPPQVRKNPYQAVLNAQPVCGVLSWSDPAKPMLACGSQCVP